MLRSALLALALPAVLAEYSVTSVRSYAEKDPTDADQIAMKSICNNVMSAIQNTIEDDFKALWSDDVEKTWEAFVFHVVFGYPIPSPYVGDVAWGAITDWTFTNVFPNVVQAIQNHAPFTADKTGVACINTFVFGNGDRSDNLILYDLTPDLKLAYMLTFEDRPTSGIPDANYESLASYCEENKQTAGGDALPVGSFHSVEYAYSNYVTDYFRATCTFVFTLTPGGETRTVTNSYHFNDQPCAAWCNAWTCGLGACDKCTTCYGLHNDLHCSPWCNVWTCGLQHCKGCDTCDELANGQYCAGWCNRWTCGFDVCAGCSVC